MCCHEWKVSFSLCLCLSHTLSLSHTPLSLSLSLSLPLPPPLSTPRAREDIEKQVTNKYPWHRFRLRFSTAAFRLLIIPLHNYLSHIIIMSRLHENISCHNNLETKTAVSNKNKKRQAVQRKLTCVPSKRGSMKRHNPCVIWYTCHIKWT